MQYVEKHLTTHHLLRAPHRWFFAFLASPIHFAEMRYKNQYHLKFAHARKLFLFDMSLVGLLGVVGAAMIFWSVYNPTVTDLVYLTVTPSESRILSGEYGTYEIEYYNESEVKLSEVQLQVELPSGFILDQTRPIDNFDRENNIFTLGSVESGEKNTVSISGWIFGTPHVEDRLHAILSYQQDGKQRREERRSPHIVFLRGSLIDTQIEVSTSVVEGTRLPVVVVIKNTGDDPVLDISVPLAGFTPLGVLENIKTTRGVVRDGVWTFSGLARGESVSLSADMVVNRSIGSSTVRVPLTPALALNGRVIPQTTVEKEIRIVRPEASVAVSWDEGVVASKPGESPRLNISIRNTGTSALENGVVEIPFANSMVNMGELARVNRGTIAGNTLVLSHTSYEPLRLLEVGESRTISVLVPIQAVPDGGTNLTLAPTVRFRAHAVGIGEAGVDVSRSVDAILVGTGLTLSGEVRYYTNEGDQLGRGPLPPEVGKETKYAAMYTIRNTTSNVSDGVLTLHLPSSVVWTGKTSVTHGQAPTFDTSGRVVRWNIGTIPAHGTAGIYMELGVTPGDSYQGEFLTIVSRAELSVFDTYLGYTLTRTVGGLDNSLPTDPIGRDK
jgi:hypothetical protein